MFFYKLNSLHTIHVHVYQPIAIIIKLSRNKLLSFDMCNKPDKNVDVTFKATFLYLFNQPTKITMPDLVLTCIF